MKHNVICTLFFTLLMLTGCGEDPQMSQTEVEPVPDVPAETVDEGMGVIDNPHFTESQTAVSNRLNEVAMDLFSKCCIAAGEDKNMSVSPVTAIANLAIIANSVDDETARSIMDYIGCEDMGELNTVVNRLLRLLANPRYGAFLSVASSVWYDSSYTVDDDYIDKMLKTFGADVNSADMGSQSSFDMINGWCSEKTHGLIPEIFDNPAQIQELEWISALYFAGEWHQPFDESLTTRENFNTADGVVETDMMHTVITNSYIKTDTYECIGMEFLEGLYNVYLYLPAEGVGMARFFESLKNKGESRPAYIHLGLPKFAVSTDLDMTEIYAASGIKTMGVKPAAMGIDISGDMKSKQKNTIQFDEKGAVAASVEVGNWGSFPPGQSEPIEVHITFDRPFYYIIVGPYTNSCVMAGYIARP